MPPEELNYSEILTIRRALDHFSQRMNDGSRSGLFSEPKEAEKKEAERLQWKFKDARKVIVET